MLQVVNNVSVACGDYKAYYKIHGRLLIWEVTVLVKLDNSSPEKSLLQSQSKEKNTYKIHLKAF